MAHWAEDDAVVISDQSLLVSEMRGVFLVQFVFVINGLPRYLLPVNHFLALALRSRVSPHPWARLVRNPYRAALNVGGTPSKSSASANRTATNNDWRHILLKWWLQLLRFLNNGWNLLLLLKLLWQLSLLIHHRSLPNQRSLISLPAISLAVEGDLMGRI